MPQVGFSSLSGTASATGWWGFEFQAPLDGQADVLNDVWVGDDVDHALAVAAAVYHACELEFAQVVTHGRDGLSGCGGQGADVAVTVGELPQNVQAHGGREQSEHGCGVLQHSVR